MTFKNSKALPLELGVWVAFNEYDYVPEANSISATGLLKPLRHIILPPRISASSQVVLDIESLIPSAMGTAFHSAIQRAWENGNHKKGMAALGIPQSAIDRVLVNPTPDQLANTVKPIPVYIEVRTDKVITVDGIDYTVSGKFDMACDGRITDFKSTTVFGWMKGNKWDDYIAQMSIYRWLNPEKITKDTGRIIFIFTDWSKLSAYQRPKVYPQSRFDYKDLTLMSFEETEEWIRSKIRTILAYQSVPEPELPECTDEELWVGPSTFKYWKKIGTYEAKGRSTRNFDTQEEALQFQQDNGGTGIVVEVKGNPKRCQYCSAFPICTQKDRYKHD